jgi:hypothetical protein
MATIYVDASQPNDNGNGLTPATAKRTPRMAQLIAKPGDKVLLKTGYCYDPSSTGQFMYFSGVSNVEVGTYGTASDKPILDALTYQNPGVEGWTYVSDGVWKKKFAAFYIRRLWVGSTSLGNLVSQRIVGTAKRRATGAGFIGAAANPSEASILAALNDRDIWFGGGSATSYALYIYTGTASIDPPRYYGGLAFIQSDGVSVGSVEGIYVENQVGIYAHDLHIRGCGKHGIRLYGQNSNVRDVADCLFEDITVTHPWEGAFASRIAGQLAPAFRCKSTTVRRVYCDYFTHEDEQEPDTSYNSMSGISDLFNVSDGSVGITIEECTAINAGHVGIVVGSTAMRTAPPMGCRVVNNKVRYDKWHTYGRGLSCYDADATTLFAGNLIDGQNTRSQFSGSGKIIGNVWTNLRSSMRKPTVGQWIAVESYIYDTFSSSIGNERYLRINPKNLLIAHNTVYGPKDTAIGFHFYSTPTGPADNSFNPGTVSVINNIVHSPASQFLSTYEDHGKTIGQQLIMDNCVYNTFTGDNKITWRGNNYKINSAPGCSNNTEVDPQLDALYRPCAAPLIRTGLYLGGKDFYGKQFYNPPNIGAVDDLSSTPSYLLTTP